MYNEGISKTGSVIDLGIDHNILSKKGAWIFYEGELVGQGRVAAKQTLAKTKKCWKNYNPRSWKRFSFCCSVLVAMRQKRRYSPPYPSNIWSSQVNHCFVEPVGESAICT